MGLFFSLGAATAQEVDLRQYSADSFSGMPDSEAGALDLLLGRVRRNEPEAFLELGAAYEQGKLVERNFGHALSWYKKAAESGLADGYYRCGMCFEIGMGTAPDPVAALAYFEKAGELGVPLGWYKASYYYINGQEGLRDEKKAFRLLQKAADAGEAVAVNDLGVVYTSALLGQTKDERKAVELFIKGAELGNAEAMKNIGVAFRFGIGRTKNDIKALKWFLIASHYGYPSAQAAEELKSEMNAEDIQAAQAEAEEWMADYESGSLPQ